MTIPLRVLLAFVLYTGLILAASFALGYIARDDPSESRITGLEDLFIEQEVRFFDIESALDDIRAAEPPLYTLTACHYAIVDYAEAYADLDPGRQPGLSDPNLEEHIGDIAQFC